MTLHYRSSLPLNAPYRRRCRSRSEPRGSPPALLDYHPRRPDFARISVHRISLHSVLHSHDSRVPHVHRSSPCSGYIRRAAPPGTPGEHWRRRRRRCGGPVPSHAIDSFDVLPVIRHSHNNATKFLRQTHNDAAVLCVFNDTRMDSI